MKNSYLKIRAILFTLIFLSFFKAFAQENKLVEVSGKVTDQETARPLPGVSVYIKGTVAATITNAAGQFSLKTKLQFPFTLVFSSVGFQAQEFEVTGPDSNLNVALVTQTLLGKEVVVSASRTEESILRTPVAIEKLDIRAIRDTPAPGFYDALENVKGVQMTTSSLTFKVPNTRGFNIPNNFRFMQMVDGVDMQAATLGVPLGNAIGPTELDIASVEITPGAASALYGMNAINGMANLHTKDPFLSQGLSFYQKTGLNHVDGKDYEPGPLIDFAVRFAKAFKDRWAFKVNGSYMRGTDWRGSSANDANPNNLSTANPLYPELNGSNNPAYDAWNKYGDDAGANAVTIGGITCNGKANQSFLVRRTGYWEKDMVSPVVDNLKFDAALHYRFLEKAELAYGYRIGKMDGVFQRGNKIQLDNVIVQNHRLELKGANYSLRSYVSLENTGDSYNVKPLADNLEISSGGSNAEWGAKFKAALQAQLNNSADLATAMQAARAAADASRVQPGTPEFEAHKNTIRGINNWDHAKVVSGAPTTGGAALVQRSHLYHADGQWDLTRKIKFVNLLVGGDARVYEIIPDGNNFVNFSRPLDERTLPGGDYVYYKKAGGFAQVTRTFLDEKLKLFGSLRLDYNPEFAPKFNPRLAAVYTAAEKHNFRVSFQNGYRFPSLFEALSYVNNGNVRRVGGLSYINQGLNYLDNSYTQASVNAFNAAVNRDLANNAAANATAAALKNRTLLAKTDLSETRPERIKSIEAGYKSVLLEDKLVLDLDGYVNQYDGFLGQVEVSVPYLITTPALTTQAETGSDEAVIGMLAANRSSQQTRYRVYTNAKNQYSNYGSALGVTYTFFRKYTLAGNVNYNNIKANKQSDVFVTGFNTPTWATNVSFGNREIAKNLGFNLVWRFQNAFLWESPLATGTVPAYHTFDAQVNYRLPEGKTTLKLGGTNILNQRYIQYAAGPTIGGLYYAAVTIDGLLAD